MINHKKPMTMPLLDEYLAQVNAYHTTPTRMTRLVNVVLNRQRGLTVLMEDVHNPHNIAAIARSCDAFGIQKITFSMQSATHFDPAMIDITARSAFKWVDYQLFTEGSESAIQSLKETGFQIIGATIHPQSHSIYDMDFTQFDRLALMMGNEQRGLSHYAMENVDSYVQIPMWGFVQSFNVSVATALILAEITRQRRASDKDFSLSDAEKRAMLEDFLTRS